MKQTVISRLATWPQDQGTDEELTNASDVPRLLVLHILKTLNSKGLLHLSQPLGPWAHTLSQHLAEAASYDLSRSPSGFDERQVPPPGSMGIERLPTTLVQQMGETVHWTPRTVGLGMPMLVCI